MASVAEQPLHRALGLTDGELERIQELLGRDPNHFELAVFSLLWSEHCGYKHSALLLKRLPSAGERVLQGPGENAGVLDLGDGEAVAFKVESHNHPSAVEPFQGAATGVGGILRDIVAMGARPIALLDGLRFGEPGWQFDRAVAGIGHYGNCLAADEMILYRNSHRIRAAAVGDLAEERAGGGPGSEWTLEPVKPFEVLSLDPATLSPTWKHVRRLFKRQAESLITIRTALGRKLTVTADHPVMVWDDGRLVERRARDIVIGDRLPLLAGLPSEAAESEIDLIDAFDERSIVVFPQEWNPSIELRRALRKALPRADARHYWLSRRELPRAAFLAVESHCGVARTNLRLRLAGPRSTVVPACIPINRDTARLIGYYLAEGCCSTNGTTFKIIWTFGQSARDARSVEDVLRILRQLGIRHSVEARAATVAITVSSRLLGRLLIEVLQCGSRSHEKAIPTQFLGNEVLRWEVLRGLFRGDGSFTFPKSGSAVKISHATTSRALHEQVIVVLQSTGVFPSVYQRKAGAEILGRKVKARPSWALEFSAGPAVARAADLFDIEDAAVILNTVRASLGSPFARSRVTAHGSIASVPVVALDRLEGPADVYDFEVPDTHLFVTTGGIVTHNCVGVPTVGGETVFDEAYADNCLVNAMCVGLVATERLTRARASGPGNVVVLFGATTGRDGIGGASVLASQELGEGSDEKRPSVQVGDPFTGKKLIEVSLELTEGGLVESLQDCGAAGLASSLAEMARDGAGIDVHLDRVPLREDEMEPWEIMISESQERMVAVVRPTMLDAVEAIFDRWELHHARIGEVTDTGELRAYFGDETLAEIPAELLTEEAPRYRIQPEPRPAAEPALHSVDVSTEDALLGLLSSPNLRSRGWIYRQYDHLVGSRTVRRPGLDAAILRLRPSMRGLAVSLDGTGGVGRLDPYTGGARAVLESARNVACAGGEPLGLTDCLNFGNPEKGEVAWELEQSIAGMADAAVALGVPVVSGNVSLYNETDGRAIHPTPVVGCVGLVRDVREVPHGWQEGDVVLLAGEPRLMLDGSAFQQLYGRLEGRPARVDLDADALLVRFLWSVAPRCSLMHDVSDGGLAVALAEAALWSGVGAKLDLPEDPLSLFGEGGGQAILAAPPDVARRIKGVPLRTLGNVGGDSVCGIELEQLQEAWQT